jgi:hypothetical protein
MIGRPLLAILLNNSFNILEDIMTKYSFKVINISVLIIWAVLIGLVIYRDRAGTYLEKADTLNEAFSRSNHWYDMYIDDQKVGYAQTSFDRSGDRIIIEHQRQFRVKKRDEETNLRINLKYVCDTEYSVKMFKYELNIEDRPGSIISGKVDDDNIIFFIETSGKRKVRSIPKNGDEPFLPITLIPAIIQKNPSPGSVFVAPVLNIEKQSVDRVQIILEDILPYKVGLDIRSIYRFVIGGLTVWSDKDGTIIKERLPNGITMYYQNEHIATDHSNRIIVDYTMLPLFRSNMMLPDVENLETLKIQIRNLDIPVSIFDNTSITEKNNVITITRKGIEEIKASSYPLPYNEDALRQYISADQWIESDQKTMRRTGRAFASANDHDAFQLTHYLHSYVFNIIRTVPTFTALSSSTVLKTRSGDHLERTVLAAAYARAAGLPTRIVGGLVYRSGFFYFHSWPEMWFGCWIPMDPSFVQFPADVSHIPLVEGTLEDIISLIERIKDLKIEIVEAS